MRSSISLCLGLFLLVGVCLLVSEPALANKRKKKGLPVASGTVFQDAAGNYCFQAQNGKVFAGKLTKNQKRFNKFSLSAKQKNRLKKLKQQRQKVQKAVKKAKGTKKSKQENKLQALRDRIAQLSKKGR